MPTGILSLSLSPGAEIPILVGNETNLSAFFQNNSESLRLYNLNAYINLPDGVSITSSSVPYTEKIVDTQGSSHYSFINLTDLVPSQAPYQLQLTLRCEQAFEDGEAIPFSYHFLGGLLRCEVDTLPRGVYDVGNQVLVSQTPLPLISSRYVARITAPSKVLKGAGTSANAQDYMHVQTAECSFINNSILETTVSVSVLLDDSCRYIGNITTAGIDSASFVSPTVSTIVQNQESFTELNFGTITLSKASDTTFRFQFAVWDKTKFNRGDYILHGTPKSIVLISESAVDIQTIAAQFAVMEIILVNFNRNPETDVNNPLSLHFSCYTGQYHEVKNIWIRYTIPDGISFLSSSVSANSEDYLDGFFLWNVLLAGKNHTYGVDISAMVNTSYTKLTNSAHLPLPVAANDSFYFPASIYGEVLEYNYTASDYADTYASIRTAVISKSFIGGYYSDGTAKVLNALAPGDLAEFKLTYDAMNLRAVQKEISLSDYFPLSANPIHNISYSFSGISPQTTTLVEPHGVSFSYGDLLGNQISTIQYKAPIAILGASTQNNNLLKLKGTNTFGVRYADRTQVPIQIGQPGLLLQKSVSGPNVMAVKAGENYLFTLTIRNLRESDNETDAFWFVLTDKFSEWFSYVTGSLTIIGEGRYQTPVIASGGLSLTIERLAPGQELQLSYQIRISSSLAPGIEIISAASTTNPYAQNDLSSFRYTKLEQSASVTLRSAAVLFEATANDAIFKIHSPVTYTIRLVIPQGTIAYGVQIRDTLSGAEQRYLGPAFLNDNVVLPMLSAGIVSFSKEAVIDARAAEKELVYRFTSKIISAQKEQNAISSLQNNICHLWYWRKPNSEEVEDTVTSQVTIFHPNYSLSLIIQNKLTGDNLPNFSGLFSGVPLLLKLTITNNSQISAVNGTVELPLTNGFEFISVDSASLCSALYQVSRQTVKISIPRLEAGITAQASLVLKPRAHAASGESLTIQASATAYYSNSTMEQPYGGETSNTFTGHMSAGVSLLPAAYDKISEDTSYRASRPGETIEIVNFLKNTGGGYDSFRLRIEPVGIAYSLFIDTIWQKDLPPQALLDEDLALMQEMPPNAVRTIKIATLIPLNSPLGLRYDFIVTAISNTPPYPQKTVINIDPS